MAESTTLPRLRLAVLSGKGGCGRSTVAVNLAYLLAATGRRVALVDLAQFGSLALLLQATQTAGMGLGPVAACLASVHKDELPEVLQTAMTTCRLAGRRISLLAAAAPQRADDLTVEGLVQILNLLSDDGYDLVLDTSHELSDRLAAALHAATHHLWVLSPDPAAGWHLLQAREIARELGTPEVPSSIILNRYHRRSGLRIADLTPATGLPVAAILPDVPGRLPLESHRGVPLLAHRLGRWRLELLKLLRQIGAVPKAPWWSRLHKEAQPDGTL